MSKQKRQFFRIEYPVEERPWLLLGNDKFEVLDASERGLRIVPLKGQPLPTMVKGTLQFRDGSECQVAGNVSRQTEEGHLVVQLTLGISLTLIMKEQRRLIQKYRAS